MNYEVLTIFAQDINQQLINIYLNIIWKTNISI